MSSSNSLHDRSNDFSSELGTELESDSWSEDTSSIPVGGSVFSPTGVPIEEQIGASINTIGTIPDALIWATSILNQVGKSDFSVLRVPSWDSTDSQDSAKDNFSDIVRMYVEEFEESELPVARSQLIIGDGHSHVDSTSQALQSLLFRRIRTNEGGSTDTDIRYVGPDKESRITGARSFQDYMDAIWATVQAEQTVQAGRESSVDMRGTTRESATSSARDGEMSSLDVSLAEAAVQQESSDDAAVRLYWTELGQLLQGIVRVTRELRGGKEAEDPWLDGEVETHYFAIDTLTDRIQWHTVTASNVYLSYQAVLDLPDVSPTRFIVKRLRKMVLRPVAASSPLVQLFLGGPSDGRFISVISKNPMPDYKRLDEKAGNFLWIELDIFPESYIIQA